eukprot:12917271-Prorocentrum_lima.AAC.1
MPKIYLSTVAVCPCVVELALHPAPQNLEPASPDKHQHHTHTLAINMHTRGAREWDQQLQQ